MASAVSMNNELLSLWLRASGGLAADEARELIERLAATEADSNADLDDAEATRARDVEEAWSDGYKRAHAEIADRLKTMLDECGDDDVDQTALWSLHADLECEGR